MPYLEESFKKFLDLDTDVEDFQNFFLIHRYVSGKIFIKEHHKRWCQEKITVTLIAITLNVQKVRRHYAKQLQLVSSEVPCATDIWQLNWWSLSILGQNYVKHCALQHSKPTSESLLSALKHCLHQTSVSTTLTSWLLTFWNTTYFDDDHRSSWK